MANSKQGRNSIDMLHGPLLMKILMFSLPLAASSILQQLFNSVDVAVVGQFVGSKALAAVGSNTPVISLLINLFVGISMGANSVISNYIGCNDKEGIRKSVATSMLVAVASGVFLMVLGNVVARPILELMGTPGDVLDMAVLYLRVYFMGMPFFMVFNFSSAIMRSTGDTRRPLYILVVAGVVNTMLNLVFVLCFGMGVEGVAIATGIANAVAAAIIVRMLLREEEPYRLHFKELKIHGPQLRRMLQIGVPAGIQGMVFSISNVFVQSTINTYGADAIAGSAAALNFEFYCYFVIAAFNGAAISFVGQNYGAGLLHRVKRVFWICMGLGVTLCGVLNWTFVIFNKFFLGLFSTDPAVMQYGATRMHIALALQFIACSYEITGSVLRGMGKSMTPAVLTIIGTCLLRVVWVSAVCPEWHGFDVLMAVYPISWTLTGVMVVAAYMRVMRKAEARFSGRPDGSR